MLKYEFLWCLIFIRVIIYDYLGYCLILDIDFLNQFICGIQIIKLDIVNIVFKSEVINFDWFWFQVVIVGVIGVIGVCVLKFVIVVRYIGFVFVNVFMVRGMKSVKGLERVFRVVIVIFVLMDFFLMILLKV